MWGERAEQLADCAGVRAERNAGDADARHHDFAGRAVAELEQLLQHLPGLGAERAELLALLDDELQLLGRVGPIGVVRLAIDAEELAAPGCRCRSSRPRTDRAAFWSTASAA